MAHKMTMDQIKKVQSDGTKLTIGLAGVRRIYLRIAPGGHRSWIARVTFQGKPLEITLGPYSQWNFAALEEESGRIKKLVDNGKDPRLPVVKVHDDPNWDLPTMNQVWPMFEATYFREEQSSEAHKDEFIYLWGKFIKPYIGELRIDKISTASGLAVLSPLLERGKKSTYNHVRSHLSVIYKWIDAAYPDKLGRNWVYGRSHQNIPEKKRIFSEEEYRALGNAIKRSRSPYKWAVLFLCLTGSRGGIFTGWDPNWLEGNFLKFPDGTQWVKDAEFVIMPGKVPTLLDRIPKPLTTDQIDNSMESLCRMAKIPKLGTHIPRKSYSSYAVKKPIEIDQRIVDAIINHKAPKIQRAYFQWTPEELLPYAERIHQHIMHLMDIEL